MLILTALQPFYLHKLRVWPHVPMQADKGFTASFCNESDGQGSRPLDGGAIKAAAMAVVVIDSVVHGAAVVPEYHAIRRPFETATELGSRAMLVQSSQ